MAILPLPKQYHPDFNLPNKPPVGPVEIDLDNTISDGLAHYFNTFSLADTNLKSPLSTKGIIRRGPSIELNGSSTYLIGEKPVRSTKFTIKIKFKVASSLFATSGSSICGGSAYDGSVLSARISSTFLEWGLLYTGSLFRFRIRSGTTVETIDWTKSSSIGEEFNITLVRDGTDLKIYSESTVVSTGTMGGAVPTAVAGAVTFVGNDHSLVAHDTGIELDYFATWGAAKSSVEIKELNKSLYQILKPKVPMVYFTPTGVPPSVILSPYFYTNFLGGN